MSQHRDNNSQKASPSFRLPMKDQDFLLGDQTRGVRFQLEYQKAEDLLRAAKIRSTIVVFGSARILEDGPDNHRRWYAAAREFARIASERGGALDIAEGHRDRVIATGGGPGIMEAANRGATEAGAPSIGLQHHPAARAGAERMVDAGADVQLPLFRDEEDASGDARHGARGVSRRIWHA